MGKSVAKVRVLVNGEITLMSRKDIIDHEEAVIIDNIFRAYKNGHSEREINKYESNARHELSRLKKTIRENPGIVLELDKTTQRFCPLSSESFCETTESK